MHTYRSPFQAAASQSIDPLTYQILQHNQQMFEEAVRRKQFQQQQQVQSMQNLLNVQAQALNTLLLNQQQLYPQQPPPVYRPIPQYVNLRSITLKPLEYYSQQMNSIQYPAQPMIPQQQEKSSRSTTRTHGFKKMKGTSVEVQTEEDITQYEKMKRMGLANTIPTAGKDDGWGPKTQQPGQDENPNLAKGKDWGFQVAPGQKPPEQAQPQGRQKSRPLPPGMTREIRMRARINLKRWKSQFIYLALYWHRQRKRIHNERQNALNFKGKLMIDVMRNFLEIFKKNQFKIVQAFASARDSLDVTDKHKLLKGEMDKRVANMKNQIRKLFSTLVLNFKMSEINPQSIEFLGTIMHNYEFPPQNFLFQFEVNRFEYTSFGALKNMSDARAECLLITLMIIRIYIFRIVLKPWQDFPSQIKKKELLESNCFTAASLMYEITMDYVKSRWFKVAANQAHLPSKYKTYYRELGPLLCERYQLPEDPADVRQVRSLEEPLIMGLQKREDMSSILDDKEFCEEMYKYLDEWAKSVYSIVTAAYKNKRQQLRAKRLKDKLDFIREIYKDNPDEMSKALELAEQIANPVVQAGNEDT